MLKEISLVGIILTASGCAVPQRQYDATGERYQRWCEDIKLMRRQAEYRIPMTHTWEGNIAEEEQK